MNTKQAFLGFVAKRYRRFLAKRIFDQGGEHLLVACQPKSGSTYLTKILANLPGFEEVNLVPEYGRREQELEENLLIEYQPRNYVAQHHVRYSEVTESLVRRFGLKPIVLVRDVFDVVMSLRDHLVNTNLSIPMAYVPDEFLGWPDNIKHEFIVDMVVPWYFSFYASWYTQENKYFVTYSDLVSDTQKTIGGIVGTYGIPCTAEEIVSAITKAKVLNTRKNKAVEGRGAQLERHLKEQIINMTSYYKAIDFSLMGL